MSRNFHWKDNTPDGVKNLYYWDHEQGTSFNCRIFELLGKADGLNKLKLAAGWPDLYAAWTAWQQDPNPEDFFEQYKQYIKTNL